MAEPLSTWSQKECWREAERIAFQNGGWLSVASRMETTPEYLKQRFRQTLSEARRWCFAMMHLKPRE